MKDNEKKVKTAEEVTEEVKTEEKGVQLTDEELVQVVGGLEGSGPGLVKPSQTL